MKDMLFDFSDEVLEISETDAALVSLEDAIGYLPDDVIG